MQCKAKEVIDDYEESVVLEPEVPQDVLLLPASDDLVDVEHESFE